MDALSAFGLFAVTAMLVCYGLEARSRWFVLAFAGACGLGSAYGFLQGVSERPADRIDRMIAVPTPRGAAWPVSATPFAMPTRARLRSPLDDMHA